jgi:hypothetical protein
MKTTPTYIPTAPSTYELLIHSQEKERSLSETLVYLLLIGSAAFSFWYAALQPFHVPVVTVTNVIVAGASHAATPHRA